MQRCLIPLFSLLTCLITNAQLPFTPGNIVVYRIGDGSSVLSAQGSTIAKPVFLDEYTPLGVKVQSVAMPTSAIGTNLILTATYTLNVDGGMTLSTNGQYLVVTGYNASVGSDYSVSGVKRVVGLIKYDGVINTSTGLTDAAIGVKMPTAASNDGFQIWCAADTRGTNASCFYYTTLGSSTSTYLGSTTESSSFRTIKVINGQLYTSRTTKPISTVGSGLPAAGIQVFTPLNGLPNSINQFEFFDLNPAVAGVDVLYTAESSGGLRKYSFDGTSWNLNGSVGTSADLYFGLTGYVNGNSVQLFATRKGSNSILVGGGQVVAIADASGYNNPFSGTPTVIADLTQGASPFPASTYSFRGVALAPVAPSACGAPEGLSAINIVPTGATLKWRRYGNISTYNYAITTSATPPLFGQPVTDTFYNATGLTTGTQYYFYVRSDCGNFNYSAWTSIPFVPTCSAPTVPAVTNNSNGQADFNWSTTSGSMGYEYALTTSATPPASGIAVSTTSYHATGLLPVTNYYFHLRNSCGSGLFSNWATVLFTTPCFAPNVTATMSGDFADFSWARITGAQGYQYALTNSQVPPAAGTATTDSFYRAVNIEQATSYFFHVRTKCATGAFSEWTTVNLHTAGLEAYPSPVRNTLTVRLNGAVSGTAIITLTNATGSVVKRVNMTNTLMNIELNDLAAGVYMVKYTDNDKKYSVKILKK